MRAFRRAIIFLTIMLLLGIVAAYVYLLPMGGLEKAVNARVSSLIGDDLPLKVTIGNIGGSGLTNLTLEDVTVTYADTLIEFTLMKLPALKASYFGSEVLSGLYELDELVLESPHITLARGDDGNWLIPGLGKRRERKEGASVPPLAIDKLVLRDASVDIIQGRDTIRVEGFGFNASLQTAGKTYSADISDVRFKSDRDFVFLDDAYGKFALTSRDLYVQDFGVVHGDTRIKLDGQVNLDRMDGWAEVDLNNIIIDDLKKFMQSKLTGRVDINGKLFFDKGRFGGGINLGGTFQNIDLENVSADFELVDEMLIFDTVYGSAFGGCAVDGKGAIDFAGRHHMYYLDADIKNFNLNNLIRDKFYSDLNGFINLEGESFSGKGLKINIRADLEESVFDEYSFHSALGDMFITTDSIIFSDSFLVTYFENDFYCDGIIRYKGDADLDVKGELNNLDRYETKFFIEEPGGRGYAEVNFCGLTRDPDISGWFESDSVWIYGLYCDSFYSDFDIDRFLTGKQGWVEVKYSDGEAWNIPYDSGYGKMTVDSNFVYVDTSNLKTSFADIAARGTLNYGIYPQMMTLDSVHVLMFEQELFNRSDISFAIDTVGFDFLQANIGNIDASMSVLGRVNYDETMDLEVKAEGIQTGPWVALFDFGVPLDGLLSGSAQVGGDFSEPEFLLEGEVDSLMWLDTLNAGANDLFLGDVTGGFSYAERILTIDSLLIMSRPGIYRADGLLHADLAFTTDSVNRLPDEPLDIVFSATDSRFDLVSLILPSVERLDGDMYLNTRLSGTPSEPHLEGFGYLKNGQLKYFDLVDSIYTDSAGVTMRDNKIIIKGIDAYVLKDKGNDTALVRIDGVVTVKSLDQLHYNVDVIIPDELPFEYELEDISGVVLGDMHVEGDSPPLVTGELMLVKLDYEVPFADDEGSPIMLALAGEDTWNLDLDIDVLPNMKIKNEDIDAQMEGELKLLRHEGISKFQGELEFLRGKGYLFDKTFTLEPGSQVFFEGIEVLNPRLDITATTRIIGASFGDEEDRSQIELTVRIGGTLETPEINTVEGSDFSREDILPLLAANYYGGEYGALDARFGSLVGTQVSQIGVRTLSNWGVGVETIEIDPASEGQLDLSTTSVTLGFQTSPQLYVYGRSTPGTGQYGQEVGFEYRFNKNLMFEGRRSDEDEYILNFKLRMEF